MILFIIIIIIKKGRQCTAEREWYTNYQSEDPSPTIPTYRQKEEKEIKSRRLKKLKFSMARSLPLENLLPQNAGSIINYL